MDIVNLWLCCGFTMHAPFHQEMGTPYFYFSVSQIRSLGSESFLGFIQCPSSHLDLTGNLVIKNKKISKEIGLFCRKKDVQQCTSTSVLVSQNLESETFTMRSYATTYLYSTQETQNLYNPFHPLLFHIAFTLHFLIF